MPSQGHCSGPSHRGRGVAGGADDHCPEPASVHRGTGTGWGTDSPQDLDPTRWPARGPGLSGEPPGHGSVHRLCGGGLDRAGQVSVSGQDLPGQEGRKGGEGQGEPGAGGWECRLDRAHGRHLQALRGRRGGDLQDQSRQRIPGLTLGGGAQAPGRRGGFRGGSWGGRGRLPSLSPRGRRHHPHDGLGQDPRHHSLGHTGGRAGPSEGGK